MPPVLSPEVIPEVMTCALQARSLAGPCARREEAASSVATVERDLEAVILRELASRSSLWKQHDAGRGAH